MKDLHMLHAVAYVASGGIGISGCLYMLKKIVPRIKHRSYWLFHASYMAANTGVLAGCPISALTSYKARWVFGKLGCNLYAASGMITGIASIMSLAAIIWEHSKVASGKRNSSSSHSLGIITAIWVAASGFGLLPVFGIASYAVDVTEVTCVLEWSRTDAVYAAYLLSVTLFCFTLPYCIIAEGIRKSLTFHTENISSAKQTKTYIALSFLSLIAWTPYALLCLQFLWRDPSETSVVCAGLPPLCAKIGTAIAPFLYNKIMMEETEKLA